MQINLHFSHGNQFTNYTADSVTINGTTFTQNLIVSTEQIDSTNWQNIMDITADDLTSIINSNPDLIIFGTGKQIQMPKAEILHLLQQKRIGFEVMPIAALCRTFNYLMGEGRKVVGIILF